MEKKNHDRTHPSRSKDHIRSPSPSYIRSVHTRSYGKKRSPSPSYKRSVPPPSYKNTPLTRSTKKKISIGAFSLMIAILGLLGTYTIFNSAFMMDESSGGGGGGNEVIKYAFIIDISDYKTISDLEFSDEDATDWYNFLTGPTMNFKPKNIKIYGDTHPGNYPKYTKLATERNVKKGLTNLVNLADDNDIIFIESGGHGSGDGNGKTWLHMWDSGAGENGENGKLHDHEFAAILENAVAKKISITIDHCYAGGMGPELMAMSNSQNVYCTTTCTESGVGWDAGEFQNGAWLHYFLDVSWIDHFGGSASVSLEEVFEYAHAEYLDFDNKPKNEPQQFDGNPSQPFYLN